MFDAAGQFGQTLGQGSSAADHARRVAEDVARRYGVQVNPDVVQVVQPGLTAYVFPIWDGKHLVMPEGKVSALSWRVKSKVEARRHRLDVASDQWPQVTERRAQVADLHHQGKTDREIATALAVPIQTVGNDRYRLGLTLNRSALPHPHAAEAKARLTRAAQLVRGGQPLVDVAAALGVTYEHLRRELRKVYDGPLPVKPRKQAAQILQLGQAGASLTAIARVTKAKKSRIAKLLEDRGLAVVVDAARPASAYQVKQEAVAARRARMAEMIAAGVPLLEIYQILRPPCGAFRTDCLALGQVWPVPGLDALHLSEKLAQLRRARVAKLARSPGVPKPLSAMQIRRARVAEMVGQGMTRQAMADALGVPLDMVASDIRHLGLCVPFMPKGGKTYERKRSAARGVA